MWDIYWITRLDNICAFLTIVLMMFITAICIMKFILEINFDKIKMKYKIGAYVLITIIGFLLIFIPNTKEAVAIYLIPKIINNEQIQKLPDNTTKLLNAKLEQWINDISGQNKKEEN
jgi:predicted ferric reductase